MSKTSDLQLSSFLPYRLNRLASEVSQNLAEVYRERFGIDIAEWRIIATLGTEQSCTAQFVAESTRMHKTRVSRATVHLIELGHVKRVNSSTDGREMLLRLTAKGQRVYRDLIPLALAREEQLLGCLNATELRTFLKSLEKLERVLGLTES